jgi:hypothetical protein
VRSLLRAQLSKILKQASESDQEIFDGYLDKKMEEHGVDRRDEQAMRATLAHV